MASTGIDIHVRHCDQFNLHDVIVGIDDDGHEIAMVGAYSGRILAVGPYTAPVRWIYPDGAVVTGMPPGHPMMIHVEDNEYEMLIAHINGDAV